MSGPQSYFVLGELPSTLHHRYAVLSGDTVTEVLISRPCGEEVPKPAHVRWRRASMAEQLAGVKVKRWMQNVPAPVNGEQPRRPTWRRAGKRVAQ